VSALPQQVIEVVDDAAFLLEDVQAAWEQIKEDVKADSPVIHAQLNGLVPINVEDRTIVLLARQKWQKTKLDSEKARRVIERAMTQVLGGQCFFRVTLDEQEEMPDINKQIQHVRKDELVRKAINVFNATIIAIDKPE
jgi:DNA polymerase III subunit gamma/tau